MSFLQNLARGFLVCASFGVVSSVMAQTWTGGTSSDWNTGSNWSGGSIPNGSNPPSPVRTYIEAGSSFEAVLNVSTPFQGHLDIAVNSAPTFTIADGAVADNSWGRGVYLARSSANGGIVNMTGGSITTRYVFLGAQNGSTGSGTWNMSGGTFRSTTQFNVGGNDSATDTIVNVNGGTIIGSPVRLGGADVAGGQGVMNINGGEVEAGSFSNNFIGPGGKLTLSSGSLTVANNMTYDDPDASAFVVGATAALNLGTGTSTFDHGLSVATGGTLGTGNNAASAANVDNTSGAFTLANGAVIDYSINGTTASGEGDVYNFLGNSFGAAPLSLNLVVDVVAADVKQSDGPFPIFDFAGAVPAGWESISWNISVAEGTQLASLGSVIVGDGSNGLEVGQIGLSGFEAFSIPEPSTTMLLGLGTLVMFLRRRIRR